MWTAEEIKRLVKAAERIANALEKQNELLEQNKENNKETN